MTPRVLVVVQRLAWLVALLASAALIIDYQNIGDPTFCGVESACFRVRASDLGKELALITSKVGLSVPHVGVVAHVLLLGASLAAKTRPLIRAVAALAVLGGLCAVGLLVAQLVGGDLCPWCAVVDGASIVGAAASVLLARKTRDEEGAAWAREATASGAVLAWSAAAAALVALPYLWARNPAAAPFPAAIEAMQEKGKVTVISFTDFECPFCRNLAPSLDGLKKDPRVVFKRKMAPLTLIHRGAEPAALGYLCVADANKEAMAGLLYKAGLGDLNDRGIPLMAVQAGAKDGKAVAACMKSAEARARLDADIAAFESSGGTGLPTTWVGRRVIKGFRPEQITRAYEAEVGGGGFSLPLWAMFLAAGAIGAAAVVVHRKSVHAHAEEEGRMARAAAKRAATAAGAVTTGRTEAKTSAATPHAKRTAALVPDPPAEPVDPSEAATAPPASPAPRAIERTAAKTIAESPRAKRASGTNEANVVDSPSTEPQDPGPKVDDPT